MCTPPVNLVQWPVINIPVRSDWEPRAPISLRPAIGINLPEHVGGALTRNVH